MNVVTHVHELHRDLSAVCRLEESLLRIELRLPAIREVSSACGRVQR